jgi:hypothetical protein
MSEQRLVDITGRLRSPAATPGHWAGCAPPNKWMRFPADPPTVEEIILVMREAGRGPDADRTRGLIAILWRAGLRISEVLALTETDLDPKMGSVLVRSGRAASEGWSGWTTGGGSTSLAGPSTASSCRSDPLFCILAGPTRGRGWSATGARGELRRATVPASRHAGEHSLKHDPGERVAVPEMLTGLQRRGGATSMATSQ